MNFIKLKTHCIRIQSTDLSEENKLETKSTMLIFRTSLDCSQLPNESFSILDTEATAQDGSICILRLKVSV